MRKWFVLSLVAVFLVAAAAPAMAHIVSRPYISSVVVRNGMATPYGFVSPKPANYAAAYRLYLRVYQQNATTGVYEPQGGDKGCYWYGATSSHVHYKGHAFSLKYQCGNVRVRAVLAKLGTPWYWMSAYRYIHVQNFYGN